MYNYDRKAGAEKRCEIFFICEFQFTGYVGIVRFMTSNEWLWR